MVLTQKELDRAFQEAKVQEERRPDEDWELYKARITYQKTRAIQRKYGTTSRRAEEILIQGPRTR